MSETVTLNTYTSPHSPRDDKRTVEIDPELLRDAFVTFDDDGELRITFNDPSLVLNTRQGTVVRLRFKEQHPLYGLSVYAIPDDNWFFGGEGEDVEPVTPELVGALT